MATLGYKSTQNYTYSVGVYSVLRLLENNRNTVLEVYLDKNSTRNEGVQKIREICEKSRIPYSYRDIKASFDVEKDNTYALAKISKVYKPLDYNSNHLLLEGVRNMGNLGTILRTMVAFGFKDLALIRPSADVYHPKVVTASMGEIVGINIFYFDSITEYYRKYKDRYLLVTIVRGGENISKVKKGKTRPITIIMGSENSGVSKEALAENIRRVSIPQADMVDSLNLSVATGILLYELRSI